MSDGIEDGVVASPCDGDDTGTGDGVDKDDEHDEFGLPYLSVSCLTIACRIFSHIVSSWHLLSSRIS